MVMNCSNHGNRFFQSSTHPTQQTASNSPREAGMHKRMGCKAQVEVKYRSNLSVVRILTKPATQQTASNSPREAGMHKRMGCKAQVEVKYRSNLSVVRILTKPATQQTAF